MTAGFMIKAILAPMYDCYSHMEPKTALVLSAGGMFGAYQAGAWQALAGSLRPDIVIGTSVGALNAWAIAGGCSPDELVRRWTDPSAAAFLRLRTPIFPWRPCFDHYSFLHHVQELFAAFRPQMPCGVVMIDLLVLSWTSGVSSLAATRTSWNPKVVGPLTVTVTAPSKPYGTSMPGVLRPSART